MLAVVRVEAVEVVWPILTLKLPERELEGFNVADRTVVELEGSTGLPWPSAPRKAIKIMVVRRDSVAAVEIARRLPPLTILMVNLDQYF